MTGTDTKRGPRACYYIDDGDNIIKRLKGQPDEVLTLASAKPEVAKRLSVEGAVILLTRGYSFTDIVSGQALPERALPGTGDAKTSKATKAAREPNAWLRAIATVKGRDFGSQQRAAGERETRKENYDRALVWVKALSTEQVASLKKHKLVKMVHAELTGVDEASLDDMLNGAGSSDQTDADDVAEAVEASAPEHAQTAQAAD